MAYFGNESHVSKLDNKKGVLLVNLGTPERPVCPGLRNYLGEFLMDPRVIELPGFFRWLLVKGIIVNFRSHKSAAAYREVWTEDGSPLMLNTKNLSDKLKDALPNYHVDFAMRYGKPTIKEKLAAMREAGIDDVIVIPLYPQYSGSTNGSVFDAVGDALKTMRWVPNLRFVNSYYQSERYIKAVADSVRAHWQQHGRNDLFVMSFHGVPKNFIEKGDPYYAQCIESAERIAKELDLNENEYKTVFQSRLGAQEWLKPYCDETLKSLPGQGVKSVDIICPGFSADCLETLEEIAQENEEYFMEAGGESYNYIPCLNDSPAHIELFKELVEHNSVK